MTTTCIHLKQKQRFLMFTSGVALILEWVTLLGQKEENIQQKIITSMVTTLFTSAWLIFNRCQIVVDLIFTFLPTSVVIILTVKYDATELLLGGAFIMCPVITYISTRKSWSLIVSWLMLLFSLPLSEQILKQSAHQFQDINFIWKILQRVAISMTIIVFGYFYSQRQQEKTHDEALHQKENAIKANHTSHELRNPLNSLKGSIDLAISEKDVPIKIQNHLIRAQTCTYLLLQLINNILDSGKAQNGALEINPQPTNLRKNCEQIWTIFSQIIKSKGLSGYLLIDEYLPPLVCVDSMRFNQVLMNLISNSIKFTFKGQIVIKIEWLQEEHCSIQEKIQEELRKSSYYSGNDSPQGSFPEDQFIPNEGRVKNIELKRSIQHDYYQFGYEVLTAQKVKCQDQTPKIEQDQIGILRISVEDTGQGISKANQKKLFTRFSQFSSDSNTRQMGTGLGLNIAKEIIQQSGGDIQAVSQEVKGTVFVACIPSIYKTSYSDDQSSIPEQILQNVQAMKLKLIIADDSTQHIDLLMQFISKFSGEVISKHYNGQSCFEFVKRKLNNSQEENIFFDFIISDLDMPLLDGISLSKKIKQIEQEKMVRQKCKIIIISGNDIEQQTKQQLIQQSIISDFIKKPYTFIELIACLYKLGRS